MITRDHLCIIWAGVFQLFSSFNWVTTKNSRVHKPTTVLFLKIIATHIIVIIMIIIIISIPFLEPTKNSIKPTVPFSSNSRKSTVRKWQKSHPIFLTKLFSPSLHMVRLNSHNRTLLLKPKWRWFVTHVFKKQSGSDWKPQLTQKHTKDTDNDRRVLKITHQLLNGRRISQCLPIIPNLVSLVPNSSETGKKEKLWCSGINPTELCSILRKDTRPYQALGPLKYIG